MNTVEVSLFLLLTVVWCIAFSDGMLDTQNIFSLILAFSSAVSRHDCYSMTCWTLARGSGLIEDIQLYAMQSAHTHTHTHTHTLTDPGSDR